MKPLLLMQTGDAPQRILQEQANFDQMFLQQGNIAAEHLHVVHLPTGQVPLSAENYAGVVITGSPSIVTDQLPWSEQAAVWLRHAMSIKLPILGVCYGHQLLAYALGGKIDYHPQGMEIGTLEIELLPAAANDKHLAMLPARFKANLIHSQSVLVPPPCAEVLARSQQDNHQILRYSEYALSTQFHPEFNGMIMRSYLKWFSELEPANQPHYERKLQQASDTPLSQSLLRNFIRSVGVQKIVP